VIGKPKLTSERALYVVRRALSFIKGAETTRSRS
jgi:hypothetical protein